MTVSKTQEKDNQGGRAKKDERGTMWFYWDMTRRSESGPKKREMGTENGIAGKKGCVGRETERVIY